MAIAGKCTCYEAFGGLYPPPCAIHGLGWKPPSPAPLEIIRPPRDTPWPTGMPAVPKTHFIESPKDAKARQSMTDIENWIRINQTNSEKI